MKYFALALYFSVSAQIVLGVDFPVSTYDFESKKRHPPESSSDCFTEDQLVDYAWNHGFQSRIEVQKYIQSRRFAKARLGELFPRINLFSITNVIAASPLAILDSFFGFALPSRWLHWSEAKYAKLAEQEELKTIFANEVNFIQGLYYNLQMQITNISIIKHYQDLAIGIFAELKKQNESRARNTPDSDLTFLEIFKQRTDFEIAGQNNLGAYRPLISQAIGLDFGKDWSKLQLSPIYVQSIETEPNVEHSDFYEKAVTQSTELKMLYFLTKSAKRQKKAIAFEPFDPNAFRPLGYSYVKFLQIVDSHILELKAQKDLAQANLFTAIAQNINSYNVALAQFRASKRSLEELQPSMELIMKDIGDTSNPVNLWNILRFLDVGMRMDLQSSTTYYNFLIARANLQRYAWQGPHYRRMLEYVAAQVFPTQIEKTTETSN